MVPSRCLHRGVGSPFRRVVLHRGRQLLFLSKPVSRREYRSRRQIGTVGPNIDVVNNGSRSDERYTDHGLCGLRTQEK